MLRSQLFFEGDLKEGGYSDGRFSYFFDAYLMERYFVDISDIGGMVRGTCDVIVGNSLFVDSADGFVHHFLEGE